MGATSRQHARTSAWSSVVILLLAGAIYLLRGADTGRSGQSGPGPTTSSARDASSAALSSRDGGIAELFRRRSSDTWVEAEGRIVKVLTDDTETDGGRNARHQRLLVDVDTDITILLAHNIDVAPRVPARKGDTIRFRGEYEWTEKGGTIHFTHAPQYGKRIEGGWIEHEGTRYR